MRSTNNVQEDENISDSKDTIAELALRIRY